MSFDERIPFLQSPTAHSSDRPKLHVVLSRPVYQCGEYVVGTIRLQCQHSNSIHDRIQSLHVYIAGRCRIDPRWHDSDTASRLYGTHPCLAQLPVITQRVSDNPVHRDKQPSSANLKPSPTIEDVAVDLYFESSRSSSVSRTVSEHCVCFWSTNVVSLFEDAKYRCTPTLEQILDWKNPPLPLILEGSGWYTRGTAYVELMKSQKNVPIENMVTLDDYLQSIKSDESFVHSTEPVETSITTQGDDKCRTRGEETQSCLDYTFYAQLPIDSPPSANLTCARFFYSVVVYAKTMDGEMLVTTSPFIVLPPYSISETFDTTMTVSPTTRVKIGQCSAFEHSNALPCYMSPTAMIEPISISSQGNFTFSPMFLSNVESFPINDPDTGICCCNLTVTGTSVLAPNGKVLLQFDFEDECDVVLVSACLQGEETARTTHHGTNNAKRVRSYLFDTSHVYVESGYTQFTQLSLSLPCDAPFSIQTDLVEVRIFCRVDVTVEKEGFESGYGVLSMELPCKVWPVPPHEEDKDPCEVSDDIKESYLNIVRKEDDDLPIDVLIRDLTYLSLFMKERESIGRGQSIE